MNEAGIRGRIGGKDVFPTPETITDEEVVRVRNQIRAGLLMSLPVAAQLSTATIKGQITTDSRPAAPGLAPERYPVMVDRYRHHYFQRRHALTLFPGVLEMLQALKKRHHWLAAATGKSRNGLDEVLSMRGQRS